MTEFDWGGPTVRRMLVESGLLQEHRFADNEGTRFELHVSDEHHDHIICLSCGKIREYESNKARLTVEECLQAAVECPAPVISICGGEPLIFKGIEDELLATITGWIKANAPSRE